MESQSFNLLIMTAKKVLETWFENTSVAGLSHASHAKVPWIRVAWIVIFIAGFCVTIYQVEHVVQLYLGFPVTTTVSMDHDDTVWNLIRSLDYFDGLNCDFFFFQSCWPTRDHIGRSTGISNPAWHLPRVVPRVVQTTGSVHPQPILPNCQLCINTEPTTSIGRLIKSSRL